MGNAQTGLTGLWSSDLRLSGICVRRAQAQEPVPPDRLETSRLRGRLAGSAAVPLRNGMATPDRAQPVPTFHGLLFIESGERPMNLRRGYDPLDIYLRCAAACRRSVEAHGFAYRLITNDAGAIAAGYARLSIAAPALIEHRFTRDVPPIPFRSAHRKLELFRLFADGGGGAFPVLMDIDAVLLRPLKFGPIEPGTIFGYDITSQVDAAAAAQDLRAVSTDGCDIRWWGGEFIAGDAAAFDALADAVDRCWPVYLAALPTHHIGDETVTSAAMAMLTRAGRPLIDLGGEVRRWWSNPTTIRQPASFAEALQAAVLHLPADKPMLARFAGDDLAIGEFPRVYRRHVTARLPLHRLRALVARASGLPRRHAPRAR